MDEDPIRSAAVQAGVNTYLEKEIRRIQMLDAGEQEKEFSALMAKEIDHISKMGAQNPEKERAIARLVALETDRILQLTSDRQQKVIAEKYELDPQALIEHYPELQAKAVELQKSLATAEKATAFMAWTAALGTLAGTLIPFGGAKKSIASRFSSGNKLIMGFFLPLASLAMGFGSSIIGSRLFGNKVREESKALVTDSRIAFERELGAAIDHKVREVVALAETQAALAAPVPDVKAGIDRTLPIQPRGNFTAEAAKDKAAGQAAATGIR